MARLLYRAMEIGSEPAVVRPGYKEGRIPLRTELWSAALSYPKSTIVSEEISSTFFFLHLAQLHLQSTLTFTEVVVELSQI